MSSSWSKSPNKDPYPSGMLGSSSFRNRMSSIEESPFEGNSPRAPSGKVSDDHIGPLMEIQKRLGRVSVGAPHPPTTSRTRAALEALKEELAAAKASLRKSRLQEISQLVQRMRVLQDLDLVFLFDATSSMGPFMEVVKEHILKIVQGISDAYPESHIRVGFVFYRDYEDKESFGSCDFTTSFNGSGSNFVEALSCVEATGGADACEDVFSGLEAVAKLSWAAHNRVVYHIADAPCHGTRFHDGSVGDDHPGGDKHGRDIYALLHDLRGRCKLCAYNFLHIGTWTHKMLQEFKRVCGYDSDWIYEDEFEGKGVDDIPTIVVKACTETISRSMRTGKMGLLDVTFVPREVGTAMPVWDEVPLQEGEVHRFRRYGGLDEVLTLIEDGIALELEKTEHVQVQVGLHPFSNDGASRWPFYAQITDHEFEMRVMVLKRFKDRLGEDTSKTHSRTKYIEQMEVQAVSAQFAKEFNHIVRDIGDARKVAFTDVFTIQVASKMYYNMEKLLSGLWKKYNSNAGYVNDKETYTDTLQAFSHWTHERSNGMVMVTDLQGVQISSIGTAAFLLCDPAIHSRDVLRFTRTNLGEVGFDLFYKSHKCNIICKRLRLREEPYACSAYP